MKLQAGGDCATLRPMSFLPTTAIQVAAQAPGALHARMISTMTTAAA